MADRPPISALIHLPPRETARAFDARGELRQTVRWSEMFHDDHARAFTVAKIARLDLLEDIRASLDKVLKEGGTFEDWQRDIVPTLQRAGWWGVVRDRDLTGTDRAVVVGPRRLRTIFDTNLRVSRAAGQWQRIQDRKDVAPFLRYSAIMDSRTRPLHRAWHGLIFPVDHSFWRDHFPPNGWRCRCTVIQLSQRQLDAAGWKVSADADLKRIAALFGGRSTKFRRATGEIVEVPAGIDPGFAYNPGAASFDAIARKAVASLEIAAGRDLSQARAQLQDLVDSPAFLHAMDEPDVGFPVMILDDALRDAIAAGPRVVTLSSATYRKQLERHAELPRGLYRLLPSVGSAPTIVAQEGDEVLILVKESDADRWLVTIVRRTASGQGLFLTSFRRQASASLPRLLRDAQILRDDR